MFFTRLMLILMSISPIVARSSGSSLNSSPKETWIILATPIDGKPGLKVSEIMDFGSTIVLKNPVLFDGTGKNLLPGNGGYDLAHNSTPAGICALADRVDAAEVNLEQRNSAFFVQGFPVLQGISLNYDGSLIATHAFFRGGYGLRIESLQCVKN